MCGIVGYVGNHRAVPIILEGLKRLEYRGYDSAGIAVFGDDEQFTIRRAKGKLRNLEDAIRLNPVDGSFGIGHTRWATHGRPTEENAHPHRDCHGDVVVVHNGIIENYLELKHRLQAEGHIFTTETDTEVVAHLVESHLHGNLEEAVRKAVNELTGSFALAVISRSDPHKIVAARYQAPLVVGTGDNEYFVASDVPAILTHTQDMIFLADGDMAVLTPGGRAAERFRRPAGEPQARTYFVGPDPGGKGRLQAFHAQGDFRAAARRARHHVGARGTGDGPHFPGRNGHRAGRIRAFQAGQDYRLRHQLARRPGRQTDDRKTGAHSGGGGLRQRVPLSRPHRAARTR